MREMNWGVRILKNRRDQARQEGDRVGAKFEVVPSRVARGEDSETLKKNRAELCAVAERC